MGVVKLGDVARESRLKWTKSKQDVPIVGLEHLIPDEIRFDAYDINTDNTFSKRFVKGQVLFGRRRAYQRKAAIAEFDGICSGDITVIQAIERKMVPELLPFIIQTPVFFDYANRGSAGSLSPRVKWEHLADYEFELPPLEEQKILADKLWAAYRLKEAYKKLLVATDEMVKSQFIEMFGNCKSQGTLSSLCATFIDGDWIESKDQSDNGIRLIQTGNVGFGFFKGREDKSRYITEETFKKLNCTEVVPGDILISRLPDPIGRACIVPEGIGKAITAVDCTIVRLNATLLPEFLISFSKTALYASQINKIKTGTTRLRVSRGNLGNVIIPIPPIESQHHFAAIAQQADKSKFGDFKSQFVEMFGNTPMSYEMQDCFSLIRNGANIKQGQFEGGIPITRIETISDEIVDRQKMGYAGIADNKYELYYLQDGDILISHINSLKHIGKCALYNKKENESIIHGMNLLCLRPNIVTINPVFAIHMLRSNIIRKGITDITKPAVNQASFSAKDFGKLRTIIPPMDKQMLFVSIAEQADKSKFELKQCIEHIDKVIKSLING